MTITLRNLLFRVHSFRPDVDEATSLMALEEAARDLARETGLATVTQAPVVLYANTDTVTINPGTGYDVYRVAEVRIPTFPAYNASLSGTQYLGTWNASTNTPVLSTGAHYGASVALPYQFYIVSNAGTQLTAIDGLTSWNAGDIMYSEGNVWKKFQLEEYTHTEEVNEPSMKLAFEHPQKERGYPSRFSQNNGVISFYPPPQNDTAIQITLSVVPQGEMDTISFPVDASNALVYGALEFVYNYPGSGQNFKLADVYRVRYQKERTNLRALAMLGYGGSAFYQPANFTGRTGRLSSWRSEGLWL